VNQMRTLNYPEGGVRTNAKDTYWDWMDVLTTSFFTPLIELSQIMRTMGNSYSYNNTRYDVDKKMKFGVKISVMRPIGTNGCMCPEDCLLSPYHQQQTRYTQTRACPNSSWDNPYYYCLECNFCIHNGRTEESDFSNLFWSVQPYISYDYETGTKEISIGNTGITIGTGLREGYPRGEGYGPDKLINIERYLTRCKDLENRHL